MENDKKSHISLESLKRQWNAAHASFCDGDYKRAVEKYNEILEFEGPSAFNLYALAYSYKGLGDENAAIKYCEKALDIDPNFFPVLQLLASIYEHKKEHHLAIEYVNRALDNPPPAPANPPDWMVKVGKIFISIVGLKHKEKELKEMWYMEPEDRTWLEWAKEYKKSYYSEGNR